MKAFIFVACVTTVLLACHKKDAPKHSPCFECAHAECQESLNNCESTTGCGTETACLISCIPIVSQIGMRRCAIQCLEAANDEASAASEAVIDCLSDKCESLCENRGTSI